MPEHRKSCCHRIEAIKAGLSRSDPENARSVLDESVYFGWCGNANRVASKSILYRIERAKAVSGPRPQGATAIDHEGAGSELVLSTFERARDLCLAGDEVELIPRVYDLELNYHFIHSQPKTIVRYRSEMIEAHRRTGNAQALLMVQSPLFKTHMARLAELALASRLPTMSGEVGYAQAGGLMNYGSHIPDSWYRAATYVDKILKGTKPADLPVEQPMQFEFVINLQTAKALGLTLSPTLLFQATEVLR